MADHRSHPDKGRRQPPAFARYAALVAEALEAGPCDPSPAPGVVAAAEDDVAADAGLATEGLDAATLVTVMRSAARGLRPRCTGRRGAPPYAVVGAAGSLPSVGATAGGDGRLDRKG